VATAKSKISVGSADWSHIGDGKHSRPARCGDLDKPLSLSDSGADDNPDSAFGSGTIVARIIRPAGKTAPAKAFRRRRVLTARLVARHRQPAAAPPGGKAPGTKQPPRHQRENRGSGRDHARGGPVNASALSRRGRRSGDEGKRDHFSARCQTTGGLFDGEEVPEIGGSTSGAWC
jgi:hypothetical protein